MTGKSEPTRFVTVAAEDDGGRLDRALARALPTLSRTRLKRLIEDGRVAVPGGAIITDPAHKVRTGTRWVVDMPAVAEAALAAQAMALDIRFEDSDILILDKPAGLVVHPAPGNPDGTLVNALLAHCGASLAGIGGVRRPGIVHRLDKDTSGLMVVAKTDRAHTALSAAFKDHRVERVYHALVWGRPLPAQGEIAGPIGRSPRDRKKMAVLRRGGRNALTRYRVVRAVGSTASLVECRLATGRTHQVRVHLAHIGHPVIADPVYGGGLTPARRRILSPIAAAAVAALGRQALHAVRLALRHPVTGQAIAIESTLPPAINHLSKSLEQI